MFTAKQLREENIAEYLLYMWQLEDIFRACVFKAGASAAASSQNPDVHVFVLL